MTEVFRHPEHVPLWEAARRGEPVDWDAILGDYGATVDWPACTFYEELMERYPEAKVLLSVRDPGRWYESARSTIYGMRAFTVGPRRLRAALAVAGLFYPGLVRASRMNEGLIWGGTFGGRFEDREHAIRVYERHNEEVRRRVPPERLLVYEVRQGWGPLCAFLGVPVPDEPFPHLNDAGEMRRNARLLSALSLAVPALALTLLAISLLHLRRRRT